MKDLRSVADTAATGRAKQACRSDWECSECGNGLYGPAAPLRCPKCGSFKMTRTKSIHEDIAGVIRRIRSDAQEAAGTMAIRGHRKSAFIVAQFRLAEEAMERAQRALFVEGRS